MRLFKYLMMAYRGKLLWKKLRKKYGPGDFPTRYVLFPSLDEEYNHWGVYYLNDYVKKNKYGYLIIISKSQDVLKQCNSATDIDKTMLKVSQRDMDCLIRFAGLIDMMGEWTIVSVKEPYDTGAESFLGKKGITKRDLVWYDIYRMSTAPQ